MNRLLMVSSDGHIGAPLAVYRDYIDPGYRGAYDDWLSAHKEGEKELRATDSFARMAMPGRRRPYLSEHPDEGITLAEICDPKARLAALEAEGAVAEVLFPGPDFAGELGYPFGASAAKLVSGTSTAVFNADARGSDLGLGAAGEQAYNRWLADYCGEVRGRAVGLLHPPRHDIEAAVRELQWARDVGLGGVQLPVDDPRLPAYWDGYWEPLWSACEDLRLPIHFHTGTSHGTEKGLPPGNDMVSNQVIGTEWTFWMARPLKILIFSGVLERHPKLKVVFTEISTDWVPNTLARMEWFYNDSPLAIASGNEVRQNPSTYWYRQCYVGASLLSRAEVSMRDRIGTTNIMFGIDYPHPEGSWLRTTEWLQQIFGGSGILESELRKILGETAIDVYNLDAKQLQPIADRVGPSYDEIANAAPRSRSEWGQTFAYMASPYRLAEWTPGAKIGSV
jgi:predicted TIM-barrel fold metal-dependent hydrolase